MCSWKKKRKKKKKKKDERGADATGGVSPVFYLSSISETRLMPCTSSPFPVMTRSHIHKMSSISPPDGRIGPYGVDRVISRPIEPVRGLRTREGSGRELGLEQAKS